MNHKNKNEIKYLDSFVADTSTVPVVINALVKNLQKTSYPREEIDEIVLSMDEAITNAIQETLRKKKEKYNSISAERREITIRYNITDKDFDDRESALSHYKKYGEQKRTTISE